MDILYMGGLDVNSVPVEGKLRLTYVCVHTHTLLNTHMHTYICMYYAWNIVLRALFIVLSFNL